MTIVAGNDIVASDFISTSAGAGDTGKVPKLNANGKLDRSFSIVAFGGTGADGALSISSGTTNINLGGAQVFIKNYTSISITGTGALTFSNPHANGTTILLKSQGNVTLTSSAAACIDVSGMGAAGNTTGSVGAPGLTMIGGYGGAALYIECAGAWNFTGTIKNNGTDGQRIGSNTLATGITKGGPKGSTLVLYNTLTANSGTSQCNNGADQAGTGGSIGGGGSNANGNDGYGIYNIAYGGQQGGATKTPNGQLLFPWVVSQYSKYPQLVPSGASGAGMQGNTTDGSQGATGGVNLIVQNTEFA